MKCSTTKRRRSRMKTAAAAAARPSARSRLRTVGRRSVSVEPRVAVGERKRALVCRKTQQAEAPIHHAVAPTSDAEKQRVRPADRRLPVALPRLWRQHSGGRHLGRRHKTLSRRASETNRPAASGTLQSEWSPPIGDQERRSFCRRDSIA